LPVSVWNLLAAVWILFEEEFITLSTAGFIFANAKITIAATIAANRVIYSSVLCPFLLRNIGSPP